MSKIIEKIKELQLKQKKMEYISYIKDLLKNDTHCIDFEDVKNEVLSQVEPFLNTLSESIENDASAQVNESQTETLSSDEIKAVKLLAAKVAEKSNINQPVNVNNPPPRAPQKDIVSNQDKLSFALDNRHLANKRVQVANDKGITIHGQCTGLDAPFVIVKVDDGPVIKVPLEKVLLL